MLHRTAERVPLTGRELEVCGSAATLAGQDFDPSRVWVPLRAIRTMATSSGPKGGYAVEAETMTPADVLRPYSVAAEAGITVVTPSTTATIPTISTATTATWLGEGAAATETPPAIGSTSLVPRTALATIKFSMQLLRQGQQVEDLIRQQLLAAVGTLLDQAVLAGAGGAAPLGLINTSGTGTQAGASLVYAGLMGMRKAILNGGGREDRLVWIGTPAVQETLAGKEVVSTSGRLLWDNAEGILGRPAFATSTAPAGRLACGDFSTAVLALFGPGIQIAIDPTQEFNNAGLVARVMLWADVAFPRPEAFAITTGTVS